MNQSLLLIKNEFFSDPEFGYNFINNLIRDKFNSEKLVLIYDPFAEDFFTHVINSDRDYFEKMVLSFYSGFEYDLSLCSLNWYQLDELANFDLSLLSPLLYDIKTNMGIYLLGCLPLMNYEPNMYLYFNMSAGDLEDIYLLMSKEIYLKNLEKHIELFNVHAKGICSN